MHLYEKLGPQTLSKACFTSGGTDELEVFEMSGCGYKMDGKDNKLDISTLYWIH